MLPNQKENQSIFIFKYYCFKIKLKMPRFLADISKYTSFLDDI